MQAGEVSVEFQRQMEQAYYLVAYLAKLRDDHSNGGSHTVPVTIRGSDNSALVIDVDGHEIEISDV